MTTLDASERAEVHAARIVELRYGEISGVEFVNSLQNQCGLSEIEAKQEWQMLRDGGALPIAEFKIDAVIFWPFNYQRGKPTTVPIWHQGKIVDTYANGAGVIVQTNVNDPFSIRIPFPIFNLRLSGLRNCDRDVT